MKLIAKEGFLVNLGRPKIQNECVSFQENDHNS